MGSQFEETLRKHRTESEAIMKIVAPKYVTPSGPSYGRPSGGGGGGSSSNRAAQAAAEARARAKVEAEQKRQAELKRQQQEAKKLADQLKKAKQEKAQSQTIGGQIGKQTSGPQPLTVSKYDPESRYDKPYKQSYWESTKQAVGGLLSDIGRGNLGAPSKYTEPFKYSEEVKKDVVAYVNPIFGTVQTDTVTGKTITGEVTYGDIQRKVEQKRDVELLKTTGVFEKKATKITSSYQGKVDSGELTVAQATEQSKKEYDVLNIEYEKEQEKSYKKYKDVPGVFERTGTVRKVAGFVPDALAISASVGVGAVNPVAGASIGLAYFGSKGLLQGTQKPTYKEIGQQGGIFAGVDKDDKGEFSILEPTELDVKYKKLRREAGVNLLIGASYGVGLVGATGKSIFTGELDALGESNIKVLSISKQTGKGSTDVIKGLQTSGGLRREFTIAGKVIKQGDKSYILPSGQGYSTTTGTFSWGSKGVSPTYYAGGDIFQVGAKGISIPVEKGFFSLGKGTIVPQTSFGAPLKSIGKETGGILSKTVKSGGKVQTDLFAGASKKIGTDKAGVEYYKSLSGKVNLEKINIGGFNILSVNKASFNPNTFGIQKVVKVGASSADDILGSSGQSFFSFGRGGGTKTVTGFGGQSLQEGLVGGVSKSISKGQIKGIITPSLKSSISKVGVSLAPPSIVQMGGTGRSKYSGVGSGQIYENTIVGPNVISRPGGYSILEQQPTKTDFIFQGSSVIPRVKTGSKSGYGFANIPRQGNILSSVLSSGQSLVPKQLTRQKIKQRTIQEQILQQPITQQPLLQQGLVSDFGFGFGAPFGFALPKAAKFGKSKRIPQRRKQPTQFQTSFTGSILNLKIDKPGISAGALSIRGIISPKKKAVKKITNKKRLWFE